MGMIVQRGFPRPPSYHVQRLIDAPDAHFYDVITNGFGAMYSYGDRVAPRLRWEIIAYIRALQVAPEVAGVSEEDRRELVAQGPAGRFHRRRSRRGGGHERSHEFAADGVDDSGCFGRSGGDFDLAD